MNKKAKEILERTKKVIPRCAQTMSKSHYMWVMNDHFPIFAERQDGCVMTSVDGDNFIDIMGSLGPSILGQNDEDVNKAIIDAVNKGVLFSLPSTLETELAEFLVDIIPCAEMVKFCKNGSDATMAAIRVSRSLSKSDNILMVKGGYHGISDAFCAVSSINRGMPGDMKKFVDMFEYNNVEDLESKLSNKKYACVIMEPVSLEAPNEGFLQKVRELCDKYKTILVWDEMITFPRLALGGAQEYYGIVPDIATIGKAMGNGPSVAAIVGKKEHMQGFNDIFFSATFFGEHLGLAASLATLKKLRNNRNKVYDHIWKQSDRFKKEFESYCKNIGINAHMAGLSPRMNVVFDYEDAVGIRDIWHQEMIKRGVFIGIQIYITYAVKEYHMDKIIASMKETLDIVKLAIDNGVDNYLDGPRSMEIFKRERK